MIKRWLIETCLLKIFASGEAGEGVLSKQQLSFPIPPYIQRKVSGGRSVSAVTLLSRELLLVEEASDLRGSAPDRSGSAVGQIARRWISNDMLSFKGRILLDVFLWFG
jgi:hypothetical protein